MSLLKTLDHVCEGEMRAELVYELFVELRVHSVLEQQVFYPALSPLLSHDQIERYGKEQYLILALMLELEQTDEGNDQFACNLAIIADRFSEHIEEHERSLFRNLEKERSAIDFSALGKRLDLRKQELLEKMRSRMKPRSGSGHRGGSFVAQAPTKHIRCA